MGNVVKLDEGDGPAPAAFDHLKMAGWPLYRYGDIVYVSHTTGKFVAYFHRHPTFKIWNEPTKPFTMVVGTYRGKSQHYDAKDYNHVKGAMFKNFGKFEEDSLKVGVPGHRVSVGNAINNAFTAMSWIADAPGKTAETIAEKPLKYFVAFTENLEARNFMHSQESATASEMFHDSVTLAVIAAKHGSQIAAWLK